MNDQKVLQILSDGIKEVDKQIYENLIVQTKARGFAGRRNVDDLLKLFQLKKYMREMQEEYMDKI